jgi:hypothetical protein
MAFRLRGARGTRDMTRGSIVKQIILFFCQFVQMIGLNSAVLAEKAFCVLMMACLPAGSFLEFH